MHRKNIKLILSIKRYACKYVLCYQQIFTRILKELQERKRQNKILKCAYIYKMNIKKFWLNYYIFYTSIGTSRRIRPSVHCCILLNVGISNLVLWSQCPWCIRYLWVCLHLHSALAHANLVLCWRISVAQGVWIYSSLVNLYGVWIQI